MSIRIVGQAVGLGVTFAALIDVARLNGMQSRGSYSSILQDNITFPPDLNRNQAVPFMSMEFQEYRRRSINEQPFYADVMKIRLPIPENLSEDTSVSYGKASLDSAIGAITESLSGQTPSTGITGTLTQIGSRLGTAATGIGAQALRELAGNVVGVQTAQTALNAASALSGIAANPFQVVLFQSPNFRTHNFTWKFIPTTLEESQILSNLIQTFKYHSLPGISNAGAVFFSYPEILKINFRPSDDFLYKFKPCVVDSITVNYAPNSPSFVRTSGAPTALTFSIKLQEIEIMTKADFLRDPSGRFVSPEFSDTVRSNAPGV